MTEKLTAVDTSWYAPFQHLDTVLVGVEYSGWIIYIPTTLTGSFYVKEALDTAMGIVDYIVTTDLTECSFKYCGSNIRMEKMNLIDLLCGDLS